MGFARAPHFPAPGLLALCASLVACTSTPDAPSVAKARVSSFDADTVEALGASEMMNLDSRSRLFIRSASIGVEVPELDVAVAAVIELVEELEGHALDANAGSESAHLSVKVPSSHLDAFLDRAAELGEETSRSVRASDVTDAYHDLDAEIANTRAFRDRLRGLLERAEKVEDVLAVERELTRVQTRLDQLEARQKRMGTDIEFSTVDVSLTPEAPRRILGPLGLLWEGTRWFVVKLFVISP